MAVIAAWGLAGCGGGGGSGPVDAGANGNEGSGATQGGSGSNGGSAGNGPVNGGPLVDRPQPSPGGGGNGTGTSGGQANTGTGASGGSSSNTSTSAVTLPPVGTLLSANSCFYQYTMPAAANGSGADPLWPRQWHLRNEGQSGGIDGEDLRAAAAWSTATNKGAGVRVAIVDDAVEVTHEDLLANVDFSLSRSYVPNVPHRNFPLPCRHGTEHGTAVAGLVAARDGNGKGGIGVAPRATLVAYDPIETRLDADIADALTRDLKSVSIYNNSWGLPDNGTLQTAPQIYRDAIERGLREGRDGKGAIYVFAAGNGGCYYNDGVTWGIDPRPDDPNHCNSSSDNSNFDGFVNHFGVIPVCAVNDLGRRPWYAERGANVLLCGLSSDRGHLATGGDDNDGFVSTTTVRNDYTTQFSGTSASTPQVTGTIALMLGERPDLTWRDVRLILARSARKNHPSSTGWVDANQLHYHPDYGFGTVDAAAAVALAKTWQSVGGSTSLVKCNVFERTGTIAIPDKGTASDAVTVTAGACPITHIEMVQVTFVSDHTYGGDLKIELISPNGLVSELANSRACYLRLTAPVSAWNDYATCRAPQVSYADRLDPRNRDYDESNGGWTFTSVRHLDESPLGTWQLRVSDEGDGDTGSIVRWNLAIWGR